jgi:hypothetical protein
MFAIAEVGFWLAVVEREVALGFGTDIGLLEVTGTAGGTRVLLSEL